MPATIFAAYRRALPTLREGGELLDRQRAAPVGTIRVGCPLVVARYLLAPILAKFTDQYSDWPARKRLMWTRPASCFSFSPARRAADSACLGHARHARHLQRKRGVRGIRKRRSLQHGRLPLLHPRRSELVVGLLHRRLPGSGSCRQSAKAKGPSRLRAAARLPSRRASASGRDECRPGGRPAHDLSLGLAERYAGADPGGARGRCFAPSTSWARRCRASPARL